MLVPLLQADPAEIGAKGAALRRLLKLGLPVPQTFVLPFAAFQRFMAHNKLLPLIAEGRWEALEHGIFSGEIPFDLTSPAPLVAVRSSAGDEDGQEASAAGQYQSVLSVRPEGLAAAVRQCWASFYGERAVAYRRGASALPQMGLLVQAMVDARVAGVLFTINPLTGSWRELPIEAVWGLGEGLVGGQTVPDRYLLRRPRKIAPPVDLLLNHLPLEFVSETISPQPEQWVTGTQGVQQVAAEAPLARKLTREDVQSLARLGLKIEGWMAEPQDIEWAQDRAGAFWILQSRPITTRQGLPRGGNTLWTRRFIGERWPEGASPLGWSIVAPVLEWFISYPETSRHYLGGDAPLRLVRGHPYLNVTAFRHLSFKLPGRPPPQFMLEFFPPDEAEQWLRRAAAPPDLRVYGSIFKTTFLEHRWERFRWNPFRNHRAWADFCKTLPSRLSALSEAPPQLAVQVGSLLIRDYIKIHITSLLFANLYYQVVSSFLDPDQQTLLLRAPSGSITAKVNRDLWLLAQDSERLSTFLKAHGHRSSASWEIFSRRWAESPEEVLRLASLWKDRPDPALHQGEEQRQNEAATRQLASPILRQAVRLCQAYLVLREEQRYHFDQILWLLKQKLCELGQSLADPSEIRFLLAEELSLSPNAWPAIIASRRDHLPDPDPPAFLSGDAALPLPHANSKRLQGLGISPGVVRGRTRTIRQLSELPQLLPGEILVARSTDPSWTPAFARAGGLILELGSQLSHGSVVAREYHLPGVVNVSEAMRHLPTGTEVVLDGRAGTVWILGTP